MKQKIESISNPVRGWDKARGILNRMGLLLFVAWLTSVGHAVEAQTPTDDLKAMHQLYKDASLMHIRMEIIIWHNDQEQADTLTAETKKSRHGLYSRLGDLENLINGKEHLVIDHQAKSMALRKPHQSFDLLQRTAIPDLDILKDKTIAAETLADGGKRMTVTIEEQHIFQIEIVLDERKALRKMTYFYDDSPQSPIRQMVVNVTQSEFAPRFRKDEFSVAAFLQKSNGQLAPVSPYNHYQFFNQL